MVVELLIGKNVAFTTFKKRIITTEKKNITIKVKKRGTRMKFSGNVHNPSVISRKSTDCDASIRYLRLCLTVTESGVVYIITII